MPDAALARVIFDALKKNLPQYDEWLGDSANPDYIGPKQLREISMAVAAAIEDWDGAYTDDEERLRAALTEITELELEGDASLADAMHIADEALNP